MLVVGTVAAAGVYVYDNWDDIKNGVSATGAALSKAWNWVFSKGGNRNIWPDGHYQKPNPNTIDWKKGDQELADGITGKGAPKGPGTANNLIKKWFRDKRPK